MTAHEEAAGRDFSAVGYGERHIAVEFFHSLTDGYGGNVCLKTLTGVYLLPRPSGKPTSSVPFSPA